MLDLTLGPFSTINVNDIRAIKAQDEGRTAARSTDLWVHVVTKVLMLQTDTPALISPPRLPRRDKHQLR